MLKLKDIKKDYYVADTTVEALKGINLNFRKNEFVSILGPSGCGKTTLLNIIGGLDKYTSGDLYISGRSTKEYNDRDWDVYRNHRVGFIFQSYNLIPHQTILGNVELALTISGISKAERIERAKKALDRVGLEGQYYKKQNQLSGGQCQRVAIARALVNEPEILLADEPTGALDTVTSIQIMDLIKEIASERLVIMVTHNPDLALKYSTRIVKLLDGEVIEDSNPFSEEDETAEINNINLLKQEALSKMTEEEIKVKKKIENKAKMSFLTAFKLSARNLYSKLKRTIMVVIAGSIGIIGVSAVLAVSQGVRDYITSIQDDLLSGNPISITKSGVDYETLMNTTSFQTRTEAIKKATEDGKINVNSAVEYLVQNEKALDSLTFNNEFDHNYISYILSMPKNYYNAISLRYGINVNYNVYTDFKTSFDKTDPHYNYKKEFDRSVSLDAINQTYAKSLVQVLNALNYDGSKAETYASLITGLTKPMSQSINFNDDTYLKTQYDLVAGSYPKDLAGDQKELLLVLDKDGLITDLTLAQLGYYSWEEFYNLIYNSLNISKKYNPEIYVNKNNLKERFTYEELMNKTFRWYPNNSIFTKSTEPGKNFNYTYTEPDDKTDMMTFKVSGIVKLKEGTTYGALKSGFLYSEATAKEMIRRNINSEINEYVIAKINENNGNLNSDSIRSDINYNLNYYWEVINENQELLPYNNNFDDKKNESIVSVGDGDGATSSISTLLTSGTSLSTIKNDFEKFVNLLKPMVKDEYQALFENAMNQMVNGILTSATSDKKIYLKTFAGSYIPNSIQIFPVNFENKDLVTKYLDDWNLIEGENAKTLTFNKYNNDFSKVIDSSFELTPQQRNEIKYTDSVGLIIGLINTLIDIVTYALVAFTALSLLVSTVMVGIITYVSVVERVKEIGVIRSLGGRKKDVSHLFNAETFMIGLASGVFGIIITWILTLIANVIVRTLSGGIVLKIANLTWVNTVVMISVSIGLTLISGLIPARSAAKKDPVNALRSE